MKYHRWDIKDGFAICRRCGVSIREYVKPRRVTQCPPTLFEREIMATLMYGDFTTSERDFRGLPSLLLRM